MALLVSSFLGPRELRAQSPEETLSRLSWLAGCWQQTHPRQVIQEQWMAPLGKSMIGMNRTVAEGRTVAFEYLRIEEAEGTLTLVALPSRQAEARFKAIEVTDSSVVFSNPDHDFPQIVRYSLLDDGSLLGGIEGEQEGRKRQVDFPMKRVLCSWQAVPEERD